jgi:hypothetical protein
VLVIYLLLTCVFCEDLVHVCNRLELFLNSNAFIKRLLLNVIVFASNLCLGRLDIFTYKQNTICWDVDSCLYSNNIANEEHGGVLERPLPIAQYLNLHAIRICLLKRDEPLLLLIIIGSGHNHNNYNG